MAGGVNACHPTKYMNYESKSTFSSVSMPGVSFKLKKVNVQRRLAFNLAMIEKFEALRAIYRRRKPLEDEYQTASNAARETARPEIEGLMAQESISREAATRRVRTKIEFPEDKLEQLVLVGQEAQEYDARECTPAMIRFFLLSIDGLTIDDQPATADLLISDGPDDLQHEIAAAISSQLGLTNADKSNLASPGTSELPVDGSVIPEPEASPTTVTTAGSAATI